MMAAAMTAGIALVVAQLGQNSAKVTLNATNSAEINEAFNRIQKYLLNSDSCSETLTYIPNVSISNTVSVNSIWTHFPPAAPVEKLKVGDKLGGSSKVVLDKIDFERVSTNEAVFILDFDRDPKPGPLNKNILRKRFEVTTEFNGAGKPIKCFSQLDGAIASACQSVGGTLTGTHCELTNATKDRIVKDILNPIKKPIYLDSDGSLKSTLTYTTTRKTCSKCSKSGCSPPSCPSGFTDLGGKCSKGDLCGFKPRWRNCYRDCRKANPPIGHYFNL